MAINQLKAGALLSYITVGLSNILGLVYTPYMLRMMGQNEYGLYSLASSIIIYLTIFDLGFGHTIVRYTAKLRSEGRSSEQYAMFGMFVVIYSVLSIIALIVGLGFYFNIDYFFGDTLSADELGKTRIIMMLMLFNLSFTFIFSIFGSIISAYEKFIFQKSINILRVLLNTGAMIVMLEMGYKAIGMVIVATVFNVVTLLINCWYCFFRIKIKIYFKKFQWGFLKELSLFSFYIFLIMIMDRIYMNSGQFVLGSLEGTASVAIFALAIQFQSIYISFSTAISSVFLPKVTAMVSSGIEDSNKYISDLFIKTGRIQFILISLVLTGFILFGKQFIILWAGTEYLDVYGITVVLFVSMAIPLIQNMGNTILRARNQLKFQSFLYVSAAVVCLLMQIYWARRYGGMGCAMAIAITQVIGYVLIMNVYYHKKQSINIYGFWKNILTMAVFPCALSLISYLILKNIEFHTMFQLLTAIGLFSLVYIIILWNTSMNQYERDLFRIPIKSVFNKLTRNSIG